jgi:hypothetical protein
MYTKSLQKKGDMLKSILPSTETIDNRREFLVPWSLGSSTKEKATAGVSSHHILYFAAPAPAFGLLPPRHG